MQKIQENLKHPAKLVTEKAGVKLPEGHIEAQVTTWGPREGMDGRRFNYQPEGFAEWHKSFEADGRPLPMYYNHNSDSMPIGEWNKFEMTDDGMVAEGRLFLNTTEGSNIYSIMKESPAMMDGVSVGAYAEEASMVDAEGNDTEEEDSYFQIKKGGLQEVSVVMHANNPMAKISKMEFVQENGELDLRKIEKKLREAGASKAIATAAASILKEAIEQRDAVRVVIEEAPVEQGEPVAAVVDENSLLLEALELRELNRALEKRLTQTKKV